MTSISTGSETVPKALGQLDTVHSEILAVELIARMLDGDIVGGFRDELVGKLRQSGGELWGTVGCLAFVHAEILKASGQLDEAAAASLARYTAPETYSDGNRSFRDGIKEISEGIVELSARWSAFWGAAGVWAAKGGSFADAFASEYADIKDDIKTIRPYLTAGVEITLLYLARPITTAAGLAELPGDVRKRYEAAALRCVTPEARTTSATVATSMREGSAMLLPRGLPGAVTSRVLELGEKEQEAFARGIGDLHGAAVDAVHGHPETAAEVHRAILAGQYGTVLEETMATAPGTLEELIGATSPPDIAVVPGHPGDRGAPAYPPNSSMA